MNAFFPLVVSFYQRPFSSIWHERHLLSFSHRSDSRAPVPTIDLWISARDSPARKQHHRFYLLDKKRAQICPDHFNDFAYRNKIYPRKFSL